MSRQGSELQCELGGGDEDGGGGGGRDEGPAAGRAGSAGAAQGTGPAQHHQQTLQGSVREAEYTIIKTPNRK